MEESLFTLEITADDQVFTIDHSTYDCNGLMLIINRGDEQFVFNMDYIKFFRAEREEEDV